MYITLSNITDKIKFNFPKLLPYLKKYGKIKLKVYFWIDDNA